MVKNPKGAAQIAHNLKVYGGSMRGGLERLERESRNKGRREGFNQGMDYALHKLSLFERVFGIRNNK